MKWLTTTLWWSLKFWRRGRSRLVFPRCSVDSSQVWRRHGKCRLCQQQHEDENAFVTNIAALSISYRFYSLKNVATMKKLLYSNRRGRQLLVPSYHFKSIFRSWSLARSKFVFNISICYSTTFWVGREVESYAVLLKLADSISSCCQDWKSYWTWRLQLNIIISRCHAVTSLGLRIPLTPQIINVSSTTIRTRWEYPASWPSRAVGCSFRTKALFTAWDTQNHEEETPRSYKPTSPLKIWKQNRFYSHNLKMKGDYFYRISTKIINFLERNNNENQVKAERRALKEERADFQRKCSSSTISDP